MQKIAIIFGVLLLNVSCSTEDTFLEDSTEETKDVTAEKDIRQNEWTYKKMREHYFWCYDMPDSVSLNFTEKPTAFFKSILSKEDRFSWCEENINFKGYAMEYAGYGFEYQDFQVGDKILQRILYGNPHILVNCNIKRGDYIQLNEYDKSFVVYENTENGLVPARKISLSEYGTRNANLAETIPLDTVYNIGGIKIGYFIYDQFNESIDVSQVIQKLKNAQINELIIDLRYNPGGYVSTSSYLASYLVNKENIGGLYQKQRFNKIQTQIKKKNGGDGYDYVYMSKGPMVQDRNLDLHRLVVLTTKNTASASESLVVCLRPYIDVITVGTQTCGKDVGSYTIKDDHYRYQLQPITFRYYNALNDSTPSTGIKPNIEVEDDLEHQRGDLNEALLSAAVKYLLDKNTDKKVDKTIFQTKYKAIGKSSIQKKYNY